MLPFSIASCSFLGWLFLFFSSKRSQSLSWYVIWGMVICWSTLVSNSPASCSLQVQRRVREVAKEENKNPLLPTSDDPHRKNLLMQAQNVGVLRCSVVPPPALEQCHPPHRWHGIGCPVHKNTENDFYYQCVIWYPIYLCERFPLKCECMHWILVILSILLQYCYHKPKLMCDSNCILYHTYSDGVLPLLNMIVFPPYLFWLSCATFSFYFGHVMLVLFWSYFV